MQKIVSLLAFLLTIHHFYGQNYEIAVEDKNIVFNTVERENQPKTKNFFGVYDGNLYLLNKFRGEKREGKYMLFIKNWNLYIISDGKNNVQYLNFEQAFPKKGFIKTGKKKKFYGKTAECYQLEGDITDMKLWFTDGENDQNLLRKYFQEMNLLGNVPAGKSLVAVDSQGLEVDAELFLKENASLYLPDFYPFFRVLADEEKCIEPTEEIPLNSPVYKIPDSKTFTNKVFTKTKIRNQTIESSYYSDDDGQNIFRIYGNDDAQLTDFSNKTILTGTYKDGTFTYFKVEKWKCDPYQNILLKDKPDYAEILEVNPIPNNIELTYSKIDKNSYPKFIIPTQSGIIKGFPAEKQTISHRIEHRSNEMHSQKENLTLKIQRGNEK